MEKNMNSGYPAYPNPTITEAVWRRVEEVLQPEVINRIGLRYINRIDKETEQDRPGTWFVAKDYIPVGFLRSEPGFLLREEIHLDAENILIITLARMAFENHQATSQSEIEKKGLPQSIAQIQKNRALILLLRSWREGDEQEQRSTWEYLKQVLDEDRLSERKLFP